MTVFHLVQTALVWEDAEVNRQQLDGKIARLAGGVIVLPEMFTTGFSMASRELAETMSGETVAWLKSRAADYGSIVCGSAIITEQDQFYNRFLWALPDGQVQTYDKRHLFRMADEHDHYSPGSGRPVFDCDDLKVMPQICYDLRFPAWSRNQRNSYDVLLYVANWPAARREQWLALLRARAIENLCYVVAVNRVGEDGNGVAYSGDSCVIDFRGEMLADLADRDTVESVELDSESLAAYRESFPAHLDADDLTLLG